MDPKKAERIVNLCRKIVNDDADVVESDNLDFEDRDRLELLDDLIKLGAHLPTPQIGNFLKLKSCESLLRGDTRTAALSLLQSQGHAIRHQALWQYNKRLAAKQESNKEEEDEDMFEEKTEEILKRVLSFDGDMGSGKGCAVEKMLESLPQEWRVVQISVEPIVASRFKKTPNDQAVTESNFPLVISTFSCGTPFEYSISSVSALKRHDRPTIMKEFSDIVAGHRSIYQKTKDFNKARYNAARDELDDRLKSLLDTVENRWLGFAKVLFLGRPLSKSKESSVTSAVNTSIKKLKLKLSPDKKSLLERLFEGSDLLEETHIRQGCARVIPESSDKQVKELSKLISDFSSNNKDAEPGRRGPVVLILDKEIQVFPWEAMTALRGQPCSRIPSVFFLSALYESHRSDRKSVTKMGVHTDKIFYVLNPNNDLEKTQARLEEPFKDLNLGTGVVGNWPSSEQMKSALSSMDAFMYCGHGSKVKTISSQEIEKLNVRAVPLLFGCNSGRMERLGRGFDPLGTASSYLIATSPSLLGFLWAVTDQDLDRWTVSFLKHWLQDGQGDQDGEKDFVRAVAQKRNDFARFLNGAATVVYGLPAFLN